MATLTGLEPATSAVTGRRANQLRHRAICVKHSIRQTQVYKAPKMLCTPNGIRTRVTAVKGRRPRPLDDRGFSHQQVEHLQVEHSCAPGDWIEIYWKNPYLQNRVYYAHFY